MYKIGVRLDLTAAGGASTKDVAKDDSHRAAPSHSCCDKPLTELDKQFVRALQQDLPLVSRPFDLLADEVGVSTETLLEAASRYIADHRMRRFSAVLRHRELGFDANAMGVWEVPSDQCCRFGAIAACFPAVSHCYLRPTYEDWPYSIFTMVHARTREQGDAVLRAIAEATGVTRYAALYSTKEYKKVRVKYFTDELPAWEARAAEGSVATAGS
jgi:DNA-binding Lrp family transcriptional regulator